MSRPGQRSTDAAAARPAPAGFSVARLRGESTDEIGAVSAIAEGRAAVALSIGGARKAYEHTDPNEDVVGFAIGAGGILVAVADGHSGADAARIAIDELLTDGAVGWTAAEVEHFRREWPEQAHAQIFAIHQSILAAVVSGGRDSARTTLAFAVVRPSDDCIAFASVGDSHVFRVDAIESVDVGFHPDRRDFYLGAPADDRESLRDKCVVGAERCSSVRAIVLATDGLSERGIGVDVPESTVFETVGEAATRATELRALETARSIAEAANAAHRMRRSGDNIGTAVVWVAPEAARA